MTQQSTITPYGDDPNYETHSVCLYMSNEYEPWRWIKDNPQADFLAFMLRWGPVFWVDDRMDHPHVDIEHVNAHMDHIRRDT